MEIYDLIITKAEINSTIIPYSCEDSLQNATMNEVLLLDIKDKFGDETYNDLINNGSSSTSATSSGFSETTQELLDEGLKLAIGYYCVSRAFRKPSVITRFGVNNKVSQDMTSENTTNNSAVSQSAYYKDVADQFVGKLLKEFKPKPATTTENKIKIIGF